MRRISASAKSSYLRKTSSFAITIFRRRRHHRRGRSRALRASGEQEIESERRKKVNQLEFGNTANSNNQIICRAMLNPISGM